jgi:hypothetical protein
VVALVLGIGYWFLRFNDPEGSYNGLTDDHLY